MNKDFFTSTAHVERLKQSINHFNNLTITCNDVILIVLFFLE